MNNLHINIIRLRQGKGISQEKLAEEIGVSRQSIAKWESGESIPDLDNCNKIAQYFGTSIDSLINFKSNELGLNLPPKGKHFFGSVTIGDRGQIVIPKKARDIFNLQAGDNLYVLGDEGSGIALIKASSVDEFARMILADK